MMHAMNQPQPKQTPTEVEATAERLWQQMPSEVRYVLRRRLAELDLLKAITLIGRHWQNGHWSITPFPAGDGFAIGVGMAMELADRLRAGNDR
ncbi:hypothetical protein [Vannielia litorea]|uniref:hypothetical protein n=1 Tax=Vannielia litorea TaxID=1217970 RepID=UPI001C945FF5|nr:hypothetical protein [Vannielia litorea]MBY6048681.1 hypothetical protein [Vannielia litorea]MBY6076095.1 hypothetical protein [Vannielia litorea]